MTPRLHKAAALLLGGLAVPLLGEAASRALYPQFRFDSIAQRFEMGEHPDSSYRSSPILGYEPVPIPGKIDSDGFRGRHPAAGRKQAGETRVLALGASVAEDFFSNVDRFDRLEERLSRAWRTDVKAWSFAVGGYSMPHYERAARHKGPLVKPDVLILFLCLDDASVFKFPVVIAKAGKLYAFDDFERREVRILWPALFVRSHLYRSFWAFLQRAPAAQMTFADKQERVRAAFGETIASARSRGIAVYAVIFPRFKPIADYSDSEERNHAVLQSWSKDAGLPTLDLREKMDFRDSKRYRQKQNPWDLTHTNDFGNDEMSRYILDFLAAHPPGKSPSKTPLKQVYSGK